MPGLGAQPNLSKVGRHDAGTIKSRPLGGNAPAGDVLKRAMGRPANMYALFTGLCRNIEGAW